MRTKTIYTFLTMGMLAMIAMAGCAGSSNSSGSRPSAPAGLTATPADSQVTLQWSASKGATSYNVYDATTTGGPYNKISSTITTNDVVTGLANGQQYYFVVTAVNSAGESGYSNEASATPQPAITKPNAPANLTAVAGNMQVALTWSASVGATGYHVYITSTSTFTQETAAGPISTATGLANGIAYYFTVTAFNSVGESGPSNLASATPTLVINTFTVGTNPGGIAIDASGNVWVSNYGGDTVSELTYASSYAASNTYAVGSEPWGIAIDKAGNIWVTNYSGDTVSELTYASSYAASNTYAVGSEPYDIAIDEEGNVWVPNFSGDTVSELTYASSYAASNTYAVGSGPYSIAIDKSGNIWVGNFDGETVSELTYASDYTFANTYPVNSYLNSYSYGTAIDASGNVWVANTYYANTVSELTSASDYASSITYPVGTEPSGIAIDKAGNVWVTNDGGTTVNEIVNTALGPQYFPCSYFTDTTCPQFQGGGNY